MVLSIDKNYYIVKTINMWFSVAYTFNKRITILHYNIVHSEQTQYYFVRFHAIATYDNPDSKVHGANMGSSGSDRTQVGPMLAPWICYLRNYNLLRPDYTGKPSDQRGSRHQCYSFRSTHSLISD